MWDRVCEDGETGEGEVKRVRGKREDEERERERLL